VWLADGTNYAGQDSIRERKRHMENALAAVAKAMPAGTRMLVEYKFFEPAFYSTDIPDWGTAYAYCLKLGEQAHVGVSYRSKIKHDVEGTVTFSNAPTFSLPGALAPIGDALNARFASGPVVTTIDLPDTLSIAAAWENEKVEVLADWTATSWDSIPELDINRSTGTDLSTVPLSFENTWRVGLGVNVKLNEKWKLRLGTAYDTAPVLDEFRTPRLPDTDRIWAAGGFEWILNQKARVDVGYAHLFIDDASSNLPNQATSTSTPSGDLKGAYKAKVDIVGVQLTLQF
jgi:long-chain fatty acid transport protein